MAKQSQFKAKKVSNYGTSHPVVARLMVQTQDLLQWADLSKEERDSVMVIYDGLKNRLLKCHEALDRLIKSLNITIEECEFQEEL